MGLDQLLELTSSVASKALPICGVVVLIFLAVFVKHLIVLLKNANVKDAGNDKPAIRNTGQAAEYAE